MKHCPFGNTNSTLLKPEWIRRNHFKTRQSQLIRCCQIIRGYFPNHRILFIRHEVRSAYWTSLIIFSLCSTTMESIQDTWTVQQQERCTSPTSLTGLDCRVSIILPIWTMRCTRIMRTMSIPLRIMSWAVEYPTLGRETRTLSMGRFR